MTSFLKIVAMMFKHAARTEFWRASKNFGGHELHAGGDLKKKGPLYGKPPFPPNVVVILTKSLLFGKPPFSATLKYQIKNNTTLFLSIQKLKNLVKFIRGAN